MTLPIDPRASDAERELAVARLREAHVEGRLTLEELSSRSELAYLAETRSRLDEIVSDLPAAPVMSVRERRFQISLFGPSRLRGAWRAARKTWVVSLFGPSEIDFGKAVLPAEGATVISVSVFGPTMLHVPAGVDLDLGGIAIFGHINRGDEGVVHPGAPRIRVVAVSVFGPTVVEHRPLPPAAGRAPAPLTR